MRKEYEQELAELKAKMESAEAFAHILPVFAEDILKRKLSGNEDWIDFGSRYKSVPLDWGLTRGYYSPTNRRSITNRKGTHEGYLFTIYINSYSLFDSHQNFDLYQALIDIPIFFIDKLNSTFYLEDSQIEAFLEKLNEWYLLAVSNAQKLRLEEKRVSLLKELQDIEKARGES